MEGYAATAKRCAEERRIVITQTNTVGEEVHSWLARPGINASWYTDPDTKRRKRPSGSSDATPPTCATTPGAPGRMTTVRLPSLVRKANVGVPQAVLDREALEEDSEWPCVCVWVCGAHPGHENLKLGFLGQETHSPSRAARCEGAGRALPPIPYVPNITKTTHTTSNCSRSDHGRPP